MSDRLIGPQLAQLDHELMEQALMAAREALDLLDADGESPNEDAQDKAKRYAADRFVHAVGLLDGHPYYAGNR